MSHGCFISFKKEDCYYRDMIVEKLGNERILGKSLTKWIDSDDIDYVMQYIREHYMVGTSVTLYLIGEHSSENEGLDCNGRNHQSFMIRELQATLYDGKNNRRSGLLGIVLPSMESKIYSGSFRCPHCGDTVFTVNVSDSTVLREFSENYLLVRDQCGHCPEDGRFCVMVRYSQFMQNPDRYIEQAYGKLSEPVCKQVHYRDIKHDGF